MSVLEIIGSTGSIQQSLTKSWTYLQGEVQQTIFKGVYSNIANLYETYKAVAGYSPTVDQLNLVYERGTGRLTINLIEDSEPQYELIGNELSNPIWTHPYFLITSPVLTADEIREVRRAFEIGTKTVCPFSGKQKNLWDMMSMGTTE
ncbi:MAG: hypothetical protein LLG04_10880, partial [Parachlamydia sp.]|nr:hypothetical protein [Parachlamydia sp.]